MFLIMRESQRMKEVKKENEHVALNLHGLNVLTVCHDITK